MLKPNKDLSHVLLKFFFLLGSLGGSEPGITVKPAATPRVVALGIVVVVMLVVMVPTVDLVVLRVSFHSLTGRGVLIASLSNVYQVA